MGESNRRRGPGEAGTDAGALEMARRPPSGAPDTQLGLLTEQESPALAELDRRLAIVRDRIRGVALSHHPGFYLFGRPGTGKTFTVRSTLDALGVRYHYHDGHLTPLGLFELLADLHDRIIVLDDVSAIFGQHVALQLLLAALGQQPPGAGGRIIQYRRQGRVVRTRFTGGIVCLSNLELHPAPLLQALKSRVHYLKYDPTDEQLSALMFDIARKGWPPRRPQLTRLECLEVAIYLMNELRRLGCRPDLRLLLDKALPDFLQHRQGETEAHWKDLVTTTLEEQLIEMRHPSRTRSLTRRERKEAEQRLVQALYDEFPTPQSRLAAWREQTGKSARAFYRRLGELDHANE
jgi:hypothetical protein